MYVYYNMTNTTSDEDKNITDKPNIKLETDELEEVKIEDIIAVSYTHLTLPTIRMV